MREKYTYASKLATNIVEQKSMNEISVKKMRLKGSGIDYVKPIDFYFYSNDEQKLGQLGEQLEKLEYEIDEIEESSEDGAFFLSGTAPSIQITVSVLDSWTERMCRVAYKFDCEFSGWEAEV